MNGCKFIAIFSSIVFVSSFAVFAQETDTKRDSDFAFTCATPFGSKADQEFPVRACSIEMVPAGNVYVGIVEEMLASRSAVASLNQVEKASGSVQPKLAPGLNAKSEFGSHSLGLLGAASTTQNKSVDISDRSTQELLDSLLPAIILNKDAGQSFENYSASSNMLQPIESDNQPSLVEPEKHNYESAGLEDEDGLLHPSKIADPGKLLIPTLIAPEGVDDSADTTPENLPPLTNVRMNFSDSAANGAELHADPTSAANRKIESSPTNDEVTSESLVIHPPMIQPYNRNQHTFVIENRGINSARDVTVEIQVPESARIVAALPINSVFSPHTAVFRFDEIVSGDKVQVHLTAVNKLKESISFVANVSAKSTYEFGAVASNDPAAALDSVSYDVNSGSSQSPMNGPRAAAVIKNPYVDKNSGSESTTRH